MTTADDSSPVPSLPMEALAEEPDPPDPLTVGLVHEDGDWDAFGPLADAVRQAARALAGHRRVPRMPASEASVVLGSDKLVRRLNRDYRGKDAATNVLSFPFQKPPGAGGEDAIYLGDVVLAAETVGREAADRRIEPRHHLQHLVVHGLLHLLGYDHRDDEEAATMERLETEILAAIGVADPYAATASS